MKSTLATELKHTNEHLLRLEQKIDAYGATQNYDVYPSDTSTRSSALYPNRKETIRADDEA